MNRGKYSRMTQDAILFEVEMLRKARQNAIEHKDTKHAEVIRRRIETLTGTEER